MDQCIICFIELPSDVIEQHQMACIEQQTKLATSLLQLTEEQNNALAYCTKKSKIISTQVEPNLHIRFIELGYDKEALDKTLEYMKNNVQVVVHVNLSKVMEPFLNDDHLRNLFEIGSSGGSSDTTGRAMWETRLFNGAYDNVMPFDRVKYGAINITSDPYGVRAACGYGQSHFVMKPSVKHRTTFVYGDSARQEIHIATFDYCSNVLYYLPTYSLQSIIAIALGEQTIGKAPPLYIEAQIHGPVRLNMDIEQLVVSENANIPTDILDSFTDKHGVPWTF